MPSRTCIGCRDARPATELVRLSLALSDQAQTTQAPRVVQVDVRGAPGRGAWVCRSTECVEAAVAKSAFSRAFRTKLADAICGDTLFDWLRLHSELRP